LASTIRLPSTWRPGPAVTAPLLDDVEAPDALDAFEDAPEPEESDVPVVPAPVLVEALPGLFSFEGLFVPHAAASSTRPEIAKERMMLSRCTTARVWLAIMRT
jgi:hypothetical protein